MNREQLKKLHELSGDIAKQKEIASELLRTAQDRFNHRTHKLNRNGQDVEITEKALWDEVFYLGAGSEAGSILIKEHPEVFEAYTKQDALADELKKFTIGEFDIDYTKMTLSDYLKMTEGMYSLLMTEYRAVKRDMLLSKIKRFFRIK